MKQSLSIIIFLFTTLCMHGQEVWSGLKEPQKVFPKGNAPFQVAERIPYKKVPARLEPVGHGQWIISDGWTLRSGHGGDLQEESDLMNAVVPGTVLTTLVAQGIYPDPYYGLNNMAIPDSLSKMDWWYEVDFTLPSGPESRADDTSARHYLLFNGINYRSEIFLNGSKIGETHGAFERGMFDITDYISDTKSYNHSSAGNHSSFNSQVSDKFQLLHLAVHVYPLDHPGIPHEQSISEGQGLNGGATSLDGPTFIASVGWDWMPAMRDRNIGLWQDVRLIRGGAVRIEDPLIVTDLPLPDTTSTNITIEVTLRNDSEVAARGNLIAKLRPNYCVGTSTTTPPNCTREEEVIALVSLSYNIAPKGAQRLKFSSETHPQLYIQNPRLWWPNGYGEANLYELELSAAAEANGEISDSKLVQFGVRELSYELMAHDNITGNQRIEFNPVNRYAAFEGSASGPAFDNEKRVLVSKEKNLYIPSFASKEREGISLLAQDDPVGPNLVIKVNGVRIFCRGGDWGMDDAMKRSSKERLEPYFKLHKELNFNIIRNWTGETTQESFYQLCDEYGMLVWNDFWMTGEDTVGPLDFELFLRNAEDVVRRFRTHPCIAIWGPRNEGFAPEGLEDMLCEIVAREDPTRHYHGQSRFLNMGTSGPWNYFEDPSYYFRERADGFNTEMGSFSIPTAATIRKFIAPEDRWPINDVWAYHDLHHTSQNFEGFMRAVAAAGGLPDWDDSASADSTGTANDIAQASNCWLSSAPDVTQAKRLAEADSLMEVFADAAQGVCYDAWRAMIEAWNSRMWNNTTGLILWMSHPAWPSFIWQTYSYDGERTGAFYGAQKACEPIHIQLNTATHEVAVINTTRHDVPNLIATATIIIEPANDNTNHELPNLIARTTIIDPAKGTTPTTRPKYDRATLSNSKYSDHCEKQTITSEPFTAAANSLTRCFTLTPPSDSTHSYILRLELRTTDGKLISENKYRFLH